MQINLNMIYFPKFLLVCLIGINSESMKAVDLEGSEYVFGDSPIPKTAGLAGLTGLADLLNLLLQKAVRSVDFREILDFICTENEATLLTLL